MDVAIKVLVVSEVRLYGEGISAALAGDERFDVAPIASRLADAARGDALATADVVLLDVSGIEEPHLAEVLFSELQTPIVGLAVRESDPDVLAWAKLGVAGILTRAASLEELATAITAAAGQQAHCSPAATHTLLRCMARGGMDSVPRGGQRGLLTSREREIGELLGLGCTNKEIAAQLYLGVSTVKNHVHNLLQKLGARSRADAVARLRGQEI